MEHVDFAVVCRDLVKVYKSRGAPEVRALAGFSCEIPRGEIFGLLGRNGAGKTTLLRILTTLLPPTSGVASIMGIDVVRDPLRVRQQLCVVLQENAVEIFLSVQDNFLTFARFHSLSSAETRRRMDEAMQQFGLTEYRHQRVIDLSGGLKRRVQVAKVFMVDKPVIFLDEVTTGMDPINKRATLDAIREQARRGRTIVLTTHILHEAEELCDRIAIIDRGTIIAQGDLQTIKGMVTHLVDVSLTFASMDATAREQLDRLPLQNLRQSGSTVSFSVKGEEALPIITAIARDHPIVHFEVESASLEDVFLELVRRKEDHP